MTSNRFRIFSSFLSCFLALATGLPRSAGAAPGFCAARFEVLFGEADPAVARYLRSGLRGLDRAGVLAVETHLGARGLAGYADKPTLVADVQALLEIRCLRANAGCGELVAWLKKNSSQYVDAPRFLEVFANPRMTVSELAELASSQFYLQFGRTQGGAWRERFAFLFSPRAAVAVVAALAVSGSTKMLGTIYDAATLGTMMKLWNAYTDPVVAPIEAHLRQLGTKQLAGVATEIQEWLIHRGAAQEQLAEMQRRAERVQKKIARGGLGSLEEKKLWEEFQSYFYGKFMAFNQSLPGNMRDGRAFVYGTEFSEPLVIADFIANRNESLRSGRRAVRQLEEKVREGTATEADRLDLEDQRKYIELQKKQVAAGLAVFLIRKYMYRDDAYRQIFAADRQILVRLDQIQHDLIEAFGLNYFVSEFFTQLQDVFRQYAILFRAADMEAYRAIESAKPSK